MKKNLQLYNTKKKVCRILIGSSTLTNIIQEVIAVNRTSGSMASSTAAVKFKLTEDKPASPDSLYGCELASPDTQHGCKPASSDRQHGCEPASPDSQHGCEPASSDRQHGCK